jgi:RES domain
MAKHPDLFIDRAALEEVPTKRVRWKTTYRLVPRRYPPIEWFERVAHKDDWAVLHELEALTNPRVRQEAGEISLVPKSRRVTGKGSSAVMAPFTLISKLKATRFSDGSYGVYYAANKLETALHEVAFGWGRFYAQTNDTPHDESFRVLKGKIDKSLHDIRGGGWEPLLRADPDSYASPQAFAGMLREAGSNGIVYPSVRHSKGECIAAFWPDVVSIPTEEKRIRLRWNGSIIDAWFDYDAGEWQDL